MQFKVTKLEPFGAKIEPLVGGLSVNEIPVEDIRKLFRMEQLVLLRGFCTFQNSNQFANYCENWGAISIWPFGKVLELVQQEKPLDHIFDHSYVPMHWDGMYRPEVPEYQIFHCVKAPSKDHGGRTTFSNTRLVLKNLSTEQKEKWRKARGSYRREMEFYNSKTVSPLIAKHPYNGSEVIRYNEPPCWSRGKFVNPPVIEFSGIDDPETFHESVKSALYHPENFYAHEWQDHDVVIADNFTLLHGREEFVSHSPRHLQRVQILSHSPFVNPGLESYL